MQGIIQKQAQFCRQAKKISPRSTITQAQKQPSKQVTPTILSTAALSLLQSQSASADVIDPSLIPDTGKSLGVTLVLFIVCIPGLWSLIKRAPKSKIVRRTYRVPGPEMENGREVVAWAQTIIQYFMKYNYQITDRGEIITFTGRFGVDRAQAVSTILYTFISLLCLGLVLSIQIPQLGSWAYSVALLSPGAGFYYFNKADREEIVRLKIYAEDDGSATDILIEGPEEEADRFRQELNLMEKGKKYIPSITEKVEEIIG